MYAGELVEEGSIRQVFKNPRHPYTRGLLDCLPSLGRDKRQAPLVPIPGQVAPALARPVGCGFAARCAQVDPGRCTAQAIPVLSLAGEAGHRVQCVRTAELPRWERRRSAAGAAAERPAGEVAVRIDGLEKLYRQRRGLFGSGRAPVRALNGIDLIATKGETLAIVGESGCGKSTLAKVLAGLETASSGHVEFGASRWPRPAWNHGRSRSSAPSRWCSRTPTARSTRATAWAMRLGVRSAGCAAVRSEAASEVARLLDVVKLPAELRRPQAATSSPAARSSGWPSPGRWPGSPDVIVADEPVSALDVSVQAAIINLLMEIQARPRRHADLHLPRPLGRALPRRPRRGDVPGRRRARSAGPTTSSRPPYHPYTEALLSAVPDAGPATPSGQASGLEGPLPERD